MADVRITDANFIDPSNIDATAEIPIARPGQNLESLNPLNFKIERVAPGVRPVVTESNRAYYETIMLIEGTKGFVLKYTPVYTDAPTGTFTVFTTDFSEVVATRPRATTADIDRNIYALDTHTFYEGVQYQYFGGSDTYWRSYSSPQALLGNDAVFVGDAPDKATALALIAQSGTFDTTKKYYAVYGGNLQLLTNSTYVAPVTHAPQYEWVPANTIVTEARSFQRTRVADNETAAASVPKAITLDEALEVGYDLEIIFNDTSGPHSHARMSCDAILDLPSQSSVPGNTGDALSEKIQRMNSTGLGSNAQATIYLWRGNSNTQIYISATQDGSLDFELYKVSRGGTDGEDGTIYQFIKQVSDIPSSPADGTILKISTEITTGFSNFVDESNTAVTVLAVGEGYVRDGTNWVRNYVPPAGSGGGAGRTVKKLFEHTADQDNWGNAAWSDITLTSAPTAGNELHITIWDGTKFLFDEVIPVDDYLTGSPQTNNNSTINGNVFRWVVSDPGSSASAAVTDLVNIGRGNANGTRMRFWTTSNKWDNIRVKVEEVTIGSSGTGEQQQVQDAGPWLRSGEITSTQGAVDFDPDPPVTAYTDDLRYVFQAQHAYLPNFTIDLSNLGAKTVVRSDGSAIDDDIVVGQVVPVRFDLANDRWVAVTIGADAEEVRHYGLLFVRSATQPTLLSVDISFNSLGNLVLPTGYAFNQLPSGTANAWSVFIDWVGTDVNSINLGGFFPVGDHNSDSGDSVPVMSMFDPPTISRMGSGVVHTTIGLAQMNKYISNVPNSKIGIRIRGRITSTTNHTGHININLSDGTNPVFDTIRYEGANIPANVDIIRTRALTSGVNLSQLQITMEVVLGTGSTTYTFDITSVNVYVLVEADEATEDTAGLMPPADKVKVNALNLAYNVRRPHDILWDFGNPLRDSRFNVEALGRVNYTGGLSVVNGDLVTMPDGNVYRANESMTTPATPDYTKWTYVMGFENIAGEYGCVKLGYRYDDGRLVVTVPEDFDWQNCRLDMQIQATKNLSNASNGFLVGLGANTPTINDNLITLFNRGVGVWHHTWHSGSPTMHVQEMDGTANTITRSEGSLELQGDLALFHGSASQEWLYHDNADSGYAWDYDRVDYVLSMEFQDDTLTYYWNYDRIGFPQARVRYQYADGHNPMLPASNPDNNVVVHYLADGNTDNSFIRIFKLRIRELYRSERP